MRKTAKTLRPAMFRQSGAIGIMTAVLLPVILGFLALAITLSQLYNRKAEMQALADAIAISAAKQLNGSADGIGSAVSAAHDVVENGYELTKPHYQYQSPMVFSEAALKFGKSSDGSTGWLSAESAKASPAGIAYVKVDTNDLDTAYGTVDLWFGAFVTNVQSMRISHTAVAGRRRLKVLPFAICAMSADPANPIDERANPNGYSELREYGFRRGVSYNLMKLSPKTATAVNYVFDPISPPPKSASANANTVGQYMCTGTVELPSVIGKSLNMLSSMDIGQFVNHLNSRFDLSNGTNGACNAISAPPDSNIRQYSYAGANVDWMTKPVVQVPDPAVSANRLQTIADLPPPNDQTPTHYGPLWVFAKPVPWSPSYASGQNEPAQGYTSYQATSDAWRWMYSTGPGLGSYPKDPKTNQQSAPYFIETTQPSVHPPGVMYRRVLNVPLLSCPAVGSPGVVLAIGKFFMTVPADTNGVYAEFAGAAPHEEISGSVELYP